MNRISKENYYLDIAETVLERATCLRRIYGAIIVKNDEIISIALNAEKDDADDQNDVQPAQSEQSDSAEQQAEQPADVQNVNTESDGE